MNWKYGIVLKENLTKEEAALFDVVAPLRNGRIDENGDIVYDLKYDHYVSVEALNWDSRHDKVVNDSITSFNSGKADEDKITTERMVTFKNETINLGKKG